MRLNREDELVNDILRTFTLNKKDLLNLASYEKELIYDSYDMYEKDYLEMVLYRVKDTYPRISKNEIPNEAYKFNNRKVIRNAKN